MNTKPMKIEAAQTIIESLAQDQRSALEKAHWRYMAFAYVVLDDEYAKQADEDRKAYPQLLKFNADGQTIVSGKRAAEFMAAITGMSRDWCEAWDAHDFHETHGVALENCGGE